MEVKIYKLTCNQTELCYYGSTIMTLNKRLSRHKSDYKKSLKGEKISCTAFNIIKNNDYKIELIEECRKEDRKERERYYITNFECINKALPGGRSKKEYREKAKEKRKEKFKCICGSTLRIDDKAKHLRTKKHKLFSSAN
jgi:hypothetical protein